LLKKLVVNRLLGMVKITSTSRQGSCFYWRWSMRTFAQKQSQPEKPASSDLSRSHTAPRQRHRADPILHLQPAIENQPLPQTLETRSDELNTGPTGGEVPRFGYDFSRIPVYPNLLARTPARLTVQSGFAPARGEVDQPPFRVNPRVPAALPAATPAWTSNGEISLGPAGLFIGPQEQGRMLRHEAFHSVHQRIAGVSEAASARTEAERLATRAESGFSFPFSLAPAPALLAFPPQPHAPWDRVWIGGGQIIGEVNEEGVAVRIILSYADIGINTAPEAQTYHCGKHDPKPIPALVARMRKAAKLAAVLNRQIPDKDYPLKTALIAIYPHANSGFREAGGKGVLQVKQEDSWEETIAHEGSHGIFAFHLGEHGKSGAPDVLAKRFAALFLELKNTAAVSRPTGVFDPQKPPPLKDDGASTTQPAGLVMVTDELWAGSGGHPWDTVDEFFASAHGAYQQKRPLLEKIVAYYGKADKKIPPLAKELFALLASVDNPKALASLKAPADTKAADPELQRIALTPTVTEAMSSLLVNPDTLPGPTTILCHSAKPSGAAPADKAEPTSQPAPKP
jgi:hypothetical protein